MRRWSLVLALAFAIGCGDGLEVAPDGGAPADVPSDTPGSPPAGFPPAMMIGATTTHLTLPFAVTASGQAGAPFGAIAMTGDVGTVALGGTSAPAFAYVAIPFAGYTLYQGFGVSPTRWDVFWLYCQGSSALSYLYDEAVTGAPIAGAAATGSCSGAMTSTGAAISLPAFSIAPPVPRTGFVVTGAQLAIAATGVGTFGPQQLPLIVFDIVDCTTTCGTPGWTELHSVIWDEPHQRVTFVIIYLTAGKSNQVELAYARSLPDLADPIGNVVLPATWSIPMAITARTSPGMPPPSARVR